MQAAEQLKVASTWAANRQMKKGATMAEGAALAEGAPTSAIGVVAASGAESTDAQAQGTSNATTSAPSGLKENTDTANGGPGAGTVAVVTTKTDVPPANPQPQVAQSSLIKRKHDGEVGVGPKNESSSANVEVAIDAAPAINSTATTTSPVKNSTASTNAVRKKGPGATLPGNMVAPGGNGTKSVAPAPTTDPGESKATEVIQARKENPVAIAAPATAQDAPAIGAPIVAGTKPKRAYVRKVKPTIAPAPTSSPADAVMANVASTAAGGGGAATGPKTPPKAVKVPQIASSSDATSLTPSGAAGAAGEGAPKKSAKSPSRGLGLGLGADETKTGPTPGLSSVIDSNAITKNPPSTSNGTSNKKPADASTGTDKEKVAVASPQPKPVSKLPKMTKVVATPASAAAGGGVATHMTSPKGVEASSAQPSIANAKKMKTGGGTGTETGSGASNAGTEKVAVPGSAQGMGDKSDKDKDKTKAKVKGKDKGKGAAGAPASVVAVDAASRSSLPSVSKTPLPLVAPGSGPPPAFGPQGTVIKEGKKRPAEAGAVQGGSSAKPMPSSSPSLGVQGQVDQGAQGASKKLKADKPKITPAVPPTQSTATPKGVAESDGTIALFEGPSKPAEGGKKAKSKAGTTKSQKAQNKLSAE